MTEPRIDHCWNGQVNVETENTHHCPTVMYIHLYRRFGIVQAGLGAQWLAEKRLGVGDAYRFSVGDYDVTIIRQRVGGGKAKIINMAEARRRREKVRP